MQKKQILGTYITPITYDRTCALINHWQSNNESLYICAANVHMVMEAHDSPTYQQVINEADLVTSDGMPLVWMLRLLGYPHQERVYGPTLTEKLLQKASEESIPIGFFGSTPEVLRILVTNVKKEYPKVDIVYAYSPPFKRISDEEDLEITKRINLSGARILFIGLGCPKQEYWMHAHRGKVQAVMLGVGAAFDFLARTKPQAPLWIQKIGLEWLFRLLTEPKRLWKRYFINNPRFIFLALKQLLTISKKEPEN
jgi:N-acetylglucosaminyldiphosphoundecaprenol N-acetyl-beta-D-mannosaminyltransferase